MPSTKGPEADVSRLPVEDMTQDQIREAIMVKLADTALHGINDAARVAAAKEWLARTDGDTGEQDFGDLLGDLREREDKKQAPAD